MFREKRGLSRLGGDVRKVLCFQSVVVVVTVVESLQYFCTVISMVFIQVGDGIFLAPGVTIGNPFGRLALGATTGFEEMMRDVQWRTVFLPEKCFNDLAAAGYSRAEVFAPSKYVDDVNIESLITCSACAELFITGTYSSSFEVAEPKIVSTY